MTLRGGRMMMMKRAKETGHEKVFIHNGREGKEKVGLWGNY